MRLRLNTQVKDLTVRFGLSVGLVSRYVTTWICFLYQQLKEIEWMPSPKQVLANPPHIFNEKYPSTYAIIDGSEIFITYKFLVGCTPNGVVSFVSPLYVGSISDVELTRVSGFISKIPTTSPISRLSIIADRGFTIQDQLNAVGVDLNIPAFLSGRPQLSADEVQHIRHIASVRIHVERAIGRIKNFTILKSTLLLTLACLANQIVCVCAWLTSFQPALVPPPVDDDKEDSDVDTYFDIVYESDYDADESEHEDD